MSNQIVFCPKCNQDTNYLVKEYTESAELKEEVFEFTAKTASCEKCGTNLYVDELEQANLKALHDAYGQQHDVILALLIAAKSKRTKRVSIKA